MLTKSVSNYQIHCVLRRLLELYQQLALCIYPICHCILAMCPIILLQKRQEANIQKLQLDEVKVPRIRPIHT